MIGARHAADQKHRVRILAAEDGMQFHHIALPGECIQVMRHGHEVGFGRQLVGRMSPVAVGENAELPGFDEALQFLLHIAEIAGRRLGIARDDCASVEVALGSAFSAETTSTQSSACRW